MCYLLTKQTPFIQCTELQIERRAPGEGKQVLEMWLPIKSTETRRVSVASQSYLTTTFLNLDGRSRCGFCWRRAFYWRGFFRAKVTKVIQTNEVSVSYRTLEKAFLQVVPVVGSDRCSAAGAQALCGAFLVVQRLQAQERALSSERSAFSSRNSLKFA